MIDTRNIECSLKVGHKKKGADNSITEFKFYHDTVKLEPFKCAEYDFVMDTECDTHFDNSIDCTQDESLDSESNESHGIDVSDELHSQQQPLMPSSKPSKHKHRPPSNVKHKERSVKIGKKAIKRKSSIFITIQLTKDEVLEELKSRASEESFLSAEHKCLQCLRVFAVKSSLTAHMERHSESEGNFDCCYCHIRFKDINYCIAHELRHFRRYRCTRCDFTRLYKSSVRDHYVDMHDKLALEDCKNCGKSFKKSITKRNHICETKCDQCGKVVKKSYLETHKLHHSNEKLFKCPTCSKKYVSAKNLELHEKFQHQESSEPAYCIECDTYYSNKLTLNSHLKYSLKHIQKDKLKLCPHCPEKMSYTQLKTHIVRKHLKPGVYKCVKCDAKFTADMTLQRHIKRVHEKPKGVKKFICEICGHAFTTKMSLILHINIHTGAKPYKCELCPSSFSHSSTLFNHNKLVHLKQKRKLRHLSKKTSLDKTLVDQSVELM